MQTKVVLTRLVDTGTQTNGILQVFRGFEVVFQCFTMELAWKENFRRQSCIPTGKYRVVSRISSKHGLHYHILNVANRDLILIHVANYASQLEGCIGVGSDLADINRDGSLDIVNSTATLARLREVLKYPSEFEINIV